jgi:hypothetical protein
MKSGHCPVAPLLLMIALASCGVPHPAWKSSGNACKRPNPAFEMCIDAPYRYRRPCTAEKAAYDAAVKEYQAAALR